MHRHTFNIGGVTAGPYYDCDQVDTKIEELENIILDLRSGKTFQDLINDRDNLRDQLHRLQANCHC
jgi:hypothetical protein